MNDRRTVYGCLSLAAVLSGSAAMAETKIGADLSADAGYASNPFNRTTTDSAGSGIFRASIAPTVNIEDATSTLTLGGRVTHIEYSRLYSNQTNYSASAGFNKLLSGTSQLNLEAGFASRVANALNRFASAQPEDPEEEDPSEIESAGRRIETISGSAGYSASLSPRSTLSFQVFASKVRTSAGTTVGNNNYDRYGGSGSYSHAVSGRLTLGVTMSASKSNYYGLSAGDATLLSPMATADFRITSRVKLTGSAGVSISDTKRGGFSFSQTIFSGTASLCRNDTRLNLCASASRSARPTINAGVATVTNIGLSSSYRLTPRSAIGGTLGYSRSQTLQGGVGLSTTANDFGTRSAGAYYSRDLGRRLSLEVRASYRDPFRSAIARKSNTAATVGVSYRLGRTQ